MQYLAALTRNRTMLFAGAAFALGAIIPGWTLIGHGVFSPAAGVPAVPDDAFLAAPIEPPGLLAAPSPAPVQEAPLALIVYVSGAVHAPDVYALPHTARVKDLVVAAGGLTADADMGQVNLAARLSAEQHIHVPRLGEASPMAAVAPAAPAGNQPGGLLDLNTASAADLEELPGVGQSIAQRIIDHRAANGPFDTVEDLQEIKGIGPALFAEIAALVTVAP